MHVVNVWGPDSLGRGDGAERSGPRDDGGGPPTLAGLAGIALLHDPGLCAGRIAQSVEQLTLNQRVPGSSPGAPTTLKSLDYPRQNEFRICPLNRVGSALGKRRREA